MPESKSGRPRKLAQSRTPNNNAITRLTNPACYLHLPPPRFAASVPHGRVNLHAHRVRDTRQPADNSISRAHMGSLQQKPRQAGGVLLRCVLLRSVWIASTREPKTGERNAEERERSRFGGAINRADVELQVVNSDEITADMQEYRVV